MLIKVNDPELLLKDPIIGMACMTWLVNQYIINNNNVLFDRAGVVGGVQDPVEETHKVHKVHKDKTTLMHRLQITMNDYLIQMFPRVSGGGVILYNMMLKV